MIVVACVFLILPAFFASPAVGQSEPVASQPATAPTSPTPLELVVQIVSATDAKTARENAVALVRMGESNPAAVEAVMTIIDTKNNSAAKVAVCGAISEVKSSQEAYKAPLIQMLNHHEPAVQQAANAALGNYADAEVQRAREIYRRQQERLLMIDALQRNMKARYDLTPVDNRNVLLLEWLQAPLPLEQLVAMEYVHVALRKGTPPDETVLAQVRTLLNSTEPDVRHKAIVVLRDCRQSDDAPRIEALLSKSQPDAIRAAVFNALGKLNNPDSFEMCVRGLTDPAEAVVAEAAGALSRLALLKPGPDEALHADARKALLDRASQPMKDTRLRESMLDAMASLGDVAFIPILVRHAGTDEPDAVVRQAAIRALGRIGTVEQADAVIGRLNDTDVGVREAAAQAVLRIFERLLAAGKQDAGTALLEKAIDGTPNEHAELQAALARQVIETYLADPAVDKALLRAVKLQPKAREAVAEPFYKYAENLKRADAKAAARFLDNLAEKVPDLFGNGWAPKFKELIASLRPTTTPATTPAQ